MHAAQVGSFCFRLITCIVFQLHGLLLKEHRLKTNHAKCEKKTTTRKVVKIRTTTVYQKRTVQKLEILERGHVR